MAESQYGADHQARRAQLLPLAIGTECPLCGEVMLASDDLDLDHSTPYAVDRQAVGDRIVHSSCNRSAGGRLGHELRSHDALFKPSRSW